MTKQLPLGIYTFEKLISQNKLYIDKTEYIYQLISAGEVYFLSRPRRFGKSLLVSTLKAIFEGKKELFKGLALENKEYDWKKHPVIHIELGSKKVYKPDDLKQFLINQINFTAERYGITLSIDSYEERFHELIRKLSAKGSVVILIDEYDKPILGNVENPQVHEIKEALKGFYSVIKSADQYLRFVLMTGVSKFSKVSVFSDLNNLYDITMDPAYATMLGYTQEELENYFSEHIQTLAQKEGTSKQEMLSDIRTWYNGYRFSRKDEKVYNPVSVMNLFKTNEFRNYWFETGTPSFLINLIKESKFEMQQLSGLTVNERAFSSYEVENLQVLPLLVQTGYITIKDFIPGRRLYKLDYPNYEVKESFTECILEGFSQIQTGLTESILYTLIDELESGKIDEFMETMKSFFANIDYDIQIEKEKYYQTVFYLVFTLLGLKIQAEVKTNKGRIDAVAETKDTIFIFEFKLFDTAEKALKQIKENEYFQKYKTSKKEINLIGAAFDRKERNIGKWKSELVS